MENRKCFYEHWGEQELKKEGFREIVLRWKADEIANLIRLSKIKMAGKEVLEIGCADGILLDRMQELFLQSNFIGLDISETLINHARKKYPRIKFCSQDFVDFFELHGKVDYVILSDITEHVPDDNIFIKQVANNCDYIFLKMPIELCFWNSSLLMGLLRKIIGKPFARPQYGMKHISGHLRGYTLSSARKYLKENGLKVIIGSVKDTNQFYGNSVKINLVSKISESLNVVIFGGAYFAIAETSSFKI